MRDHGAGEQAVTVLGEHRQVPNRIFHAQPDEPMEHQVEGDLLSKLAFRAKRVRGLQQQRLEHPLGRDDGRPVLV